MDFIEQHNKTLCKLVQQYKEENPERQFVNWDKIAEQIGGKYKSYVLKKQWYSIMKIRNRRKFTQEEDRRLIRNVRELGEKWDLISKFFIDRAPRTLKQRFIDLKRNALFGELQEEESEEENLVPQNQSEKDQSDSVSETSTDSVSDTSSDCSETSEYYSDQFEDEKKIIIPDPTPETHLFTKVVADVPPKERFPAVIAFGLFEPPRIGFW